MVEVIGHEQARSALAHHAGSFALLGPSGVGRTRIVDEWIGDRWRDRVDFDRLDQAFLDGVIYTLDADAQNVPWERLLRPLEEGRMTVAIVATEIPDPVQTRLPIFRVGLLSEFEVSRILQANNRALQPRSLIAKLLGGSLDNLDLAVAASKTFDTLATVLTTGNFDGTVRFADYRAALFAFQLCCAGALGVSSAPVKAEVLQRIPWALAYQALGCPVTDRMSESEARNYFTLFVRQAVRG